MRLAGRRRLTTYEWTRAVIAPPTAPISPPAPPPMSTVVTGPIETTDGSPLEIMPFAARPETTAPKHHPTTAPNPVPSVLVRVRRLSVKIAYLAEDRRAATGVPDNRTQQIADSVSATVSRARDAGQNYRGIFTRARDIPYLVGLG